MAILQIGAPKSGNFWLYKIIQQLLGRAGLPTRSFIEQQPVYSIAKKWDLHFDGQARIDMIDITDLQDRYRISSIFQMPIDSIAGYARQAPHVWTHSPVCKRSSEVFDAFDKKVCIIRDPRDRVISAAKYYCSAYMQRYFPQEEKAPEKFLQKNFETMMHYWVWHVFDHLRLSQPHRIHVCFFEGFIMDFQNELDGLLGYLEIDLDEGQRTALEKTVSFEQMKKKNPEHLKKGQAGYWMNKLTDQQVETAEAIAGPLIRHLGYPANKGEPMQFSRNTGPVDYAMLKAEIIESQKMPSADIVR